MFGDWTGVGGAAELEGKVEQVPVVNDATGESTDGVRSHLRTRCESVHRNTVLSTAAPGEAGFRYFMGWNHVWAFFSLKTLCI